jgi:2-keto-4-pentenoate hydratase/2-oxohepta-3-ene-1,7-dioic acid hydratase in catechol pathway
LHLNIYGSNYYISLLYQLETCYYGDSMPGKKKRSFYLPDEVDKQLNDYVAANYSGRDVYGAWSTVVSNAVSYYCVNADTSATAPMNPHLIDDEKISKVITRIIDEHKETLDGLAEDDVKTVFTDFSNNITKELGLEDEVAYEEAKEKAEYEAEMANAIATKQAMDEYEEQQRLEEEERLEYENSGGCPDGDDGDV